jgi:ligand-binding SRPBCC domain-containing protein
MITITRLSAARYHLHAEMFLPRSPQELFEFFSDVNNLERITPALLNFHVLSSSTPSIERGTLIDYKLRIRGFPVRWRTEISTWDPPRSFSDRQLKGPYKQWIHTHLFEPRDGGTLCLDDVDYIVPGGPLAPLIHKLAVAPDVRAIFEYRQRVLNELFPA